MSAPAPWDNELARAIVENLKHHDGAMLPMLHALQEAFGFVDVTAVPLVAEALNLSRAEVHGVLTFYHDFRTSAEPRRVIKLCRAEACQSLGCEALVEHAATWHGVRENGVGPVKIETVYCLGLCAQGPAALVEGEVVAHLDGARLSALIEGAAPADVAAGEGL